MAAPRGSDMLRLVGWINRLEWQTVYDRLYSDDVDLQQQAVDIIGAWKSRFGEQIPVSIECSASLMRAQIMDKQGVSTDAVQLAYSIAIARFVNLITGREQTGLKSRSVSELASKVGLPSWMVDLRHEAVHRFLPSTSVLREGVDHALEWLRKEYWEAQSRKGHLEKEPVGLDGDSKMKESVAAGLIVYQQEQFQVMEDQQKHNAASSCDKSLADLEELLISNQNARHIIVSLLLLDGYLVPTQEQLDYLQITKAFSEDNDKTPVLDSKLIALWTPLLKLLHSLNITPLLLASLLRELAKFMQPCNQTAVLLQGWAALIAMEAGRGPTTNQSPGSKRSRSPHSNGESSKTLYEGCKTIRLPWNDLVNICIENPNHYTLAVLPKMLWHMTPKPSFSMVKKITHLCSMVMQQPPKDTDKVSEKDCQVTEKNANKKPKGNAKKKPTGAKTTAGGDDGWKASESSALDVQRTPSENAGQDVPSSSGPADELSSQPMEEDVQISESHSVEELIGLVTKKQKDLRGLEGVSAQSTKDAKELRRGKSGVWTRCTASIDWSAYPLGVLPGQPDDPDYFVLRNFHKKNGKRSSEALKDQNPNENWKSPQQKIPKMDHIDKPQPNQSERKSDSNEMEEEVKNREVHSSHMMPSSYEREIPVGRFPELVVQDEGCSQDAVVENVEKNEVKRLENVLENELDNDSRIEEQDQDHAVSEKIMLF